MGARGVPRPSERWVLVPGLCLGRREETDTPGPDSRPLIQQVLYSSQRQFHGPTHRSWGSSPPEAKELRGVPQSQEFRGVQDPPVSSGAGLPSGGKGREKKLG